MNDDGGTQEVKCRLARVPLNAGTSGSRRRSRSRLRVEGGEQETKVETRSALLYDLSSLPQ